MPKEPEKSTAMQDRGVREVVVTDDEDGQRLDNFLRTRMKGVPKGAVYRRIRTGQVRVNGSRAKPMQKLSRGDRVRIPPVSVTLPDAAAADPQRVAQIRAAIIHRQEDWLVVNKPAGMAVHSGSGLPWGLIDVLAHAVPDAKPHLVHRLDRDTSGCLLIALDRARASQLQQAFQSGAIRKTYQCLLSGVLEQETVSVDAAIAAGRQQGEKTMQVDETGRQAQSRFRRLQRYRLSIDHDDDTEHRLDFCAVGIDTGRTHQIRVHAQSLGVPLAGDDKYGDPEFNRRLRGLGLKRQFLHASELSVPVGSGADHEDWITVSAPLPADLQGVMQALSTASSAPS